MSMNSVRELYRKHAYKELTPEDAARVIRRLKQFAFGEIPCKYNEQITALRDLRDMLLGKPDQNINMDVTSNGESIAAIKTEITPEEVQQQLDDYVRDRVRKSTPEHSRLAQPNGN